MTPVRVFPDAAALGEALAADILAGLAAARRAGRRYLLGCPGGRTGRSTYQALGRLAATTDLGHLVVVMMDDYVERDGDGRWCRVPPDAHFSCDGFARREIVGAFDAPTRATVLPGHVWLPDPGDPAAHEQRIAEAGGIDLFLVASGTSDGHVAFNPPATPLDSRTRVVRLAESTRRDNLATFPDFRSLDEVPTHGVTVGLGTIVDGARTVRLVLHGDAKRPAARRLLAAQGFDPGWPATVVHACPDAQIWLDAAAHPGGLDAQLPGDARGTGSEEIA